MNYRHIRDFARTETTAEKVTRVVADVLVRANVTSPDDAITPDAKLHDDLGCDSLDLLEIQMCCDDEFGIEIQDADFDAVVTVGDLAQLVERLNNG